MSLVRDKTAKDEAWVREFLRERWGGVVMAVHGEAIDASLCPALVAGAREGLAAYRMLSDEEAELVSLNAVTPGRGIGTALINALAARCSQRGAKRIWVTTTNANLRGLRFYQCRGFRLMRLRPGAVDEARRIKLSIPLVSDEGIPIRDELDLCRDVNFKSAIHALWHHRLGRSPSQ
ncbi:MAG: GNAT family N-acetyltransferase [Acetobacteraceae bacterium]|nr:GNAT family N-acetyltransferase [Acetobacteraceae bacterium]